VESGKWIVKMEADSELPTPWAVHVGRRTPHAAYLRVRRLRKQIDDLRRSRRRKRHRSSCFLRPTTSLRLRTMDTMIDGRGVARLPTQLEPCGEVCAILLSMCG
jgi:hypothetical protein